MIAIILAAQLVSDRVFGELCAGPNCGPHPSAWTELKPDSEGRYMIMDHNRWRWHSLKELFERD